MGFKKTKISKHQSLKHLKSKNYLKLTIIRFIIDFHENLLFKFNLLSSPSTILYRNDHYISVAKFYLVCVNFIIQKFSKPQTIIKPSLINKMEGLIKTKFYIYLPACKATYDLMLLEYDDLLQEIQALSEEFTPGDNVLSIFPTVTYIKELLSNNLLKEKQHQYKKDAIENKILTQTQQIQNKDITLYDLTKLTTSFDILIQK
jgi:hypothetical protein